MHGRCGDYRHPLDAITPQFFEGSGIMNKRQRSIIERKIRYNGHVSDYLCNVIMLNSERAILTYDLNQAISVGDSEASLLLPPGSRTVAFYWMDRPYNVYLWRDSAGRILGAYFNLVKNTRISEKMVSYEDLIVDLLILPDGKLSVLDLPELPEPLNRFEKGSVRLTLEALKFKAHQIIKECLTEMEKGDQ
jgi:predicted RNA-binding protein associated with RNAse of E/G family